jgi:hypothetical protein
MDSIPVIDLSALLFASTAAGEALNLMIILKGSWAKPMHTSNAIACAVFLANVSGACNRILKRPEFFAGQLFMAAFPL